MTTPLGIPNETNSEDEIKLYAMAMTCRCARNRENAEHKYLNVPDDLAVYLEFTKIVIRFWPNKIVVWEVDIDKDGLKVTWGPGAKLNYADELSKAFGGRP